MFSLSVTLAQNIRNQRVAATPRAAAGRALGAFCDTVMRALFLPSRAGPGRMSGGRGGAGRDGAELV